MYTKKYLDLSDIEAYRIAYDLSNYIWDIVLKWDYFQKNTVGIQFVKAADSISANISEGFGRYSKKDKIRFYRIGMGSTRESFNWYSKSVVRKLLSNKEEIYIKGELDKLPKAINSLIKFTNKKLKV